MALESVYEREYFRVDTFLPLKASLVPPNMREGLVSSEASFQHLTPTIVNISGGGISFRSFTEYKEGDLLKILLTIPLSAPITLCLYGEVRRAQKTPEYSHLFISFINTNEKIRDIIVSFIFQLERKSLMNTQQAVNDVFTSLPVSSFIDNVSIPVDIFIRENDGTRFLFDAGLPIDAATRDFFAVRNITKLLVREEDMPLLMRNKTKTPAFDRDNVASFKEYSFIKSKHLPIDKALLVPNTEINFDLYSMKDFTLTAAVTAQPGLSVVLDDGVASAPGDILIKKKDIPLFLDYLERLTVSDKAAMVSYLHERILKERAKIIIDLLLADPENKKLMEDTLAVVREMVGAVRENADAVYSLLYLRNGDLYTSIHSVNVAVLCIAVAGVMTLRPEIVERLAVGAILHDIGHGMINNEITNKQGRLSTTEYEILKTHVVLGMNILKGHENIHEDSLNALLQHHETISGNGYPFHIPGPKITLFGRITSIADRYDLLITNRPYKAPQTPFQALSTLSKESHSSDPKILKHFIKILARIK